MVATDASFTMVKPSPSVSALGGEVIPLKRLLIHDKSIAPAATNLKTSAIMIKRKAVRKPKAKAKAKPSRVKRPGKRQLTVLDERVNPEAAGIDIGAEELVASVDPASTSERPVRTFGSCTAELHRLKDWLVACGVRTVALESTGNYWVAIYQILEDAGLEVCLVCAHEVKNVSGRKTDVCDAQWLRQLHTAGLLKASFRPAREIIPLRYLMRHRAGLIQDAGSQIQLMQKVLTEMNIKLHHVFSDLDGMSAMRIIEAILAGERDPEALWKLRDGRCRKSKEDFMAAIQGDWREEYLFVLGQCVETWKHLQNVLRRCEARIQALVEALDVPEVAAAPAPARETALPPSPPRPKKRRTPPKNDPGTYLHAEAQRFYGVDLTTIEGISTGTLAVLMSEVGTRDQILQAFPTAARFCSWLGLCPDNRITGGRVRSTKTRRNPNRLSTCLRVAGQSLTRAKGPMGQYCQRMKARLGKAEGTTAAAHKLARTIYGMLQTLEPYDEEKAFRLSPRNLQRKLKNLTQNALKMGYQLVPLQTITS
jgi:transposase